MVRYTKLGIIQLGVGGGILLFYFLFFSYDSYRNVVQYVPSIYFPIALILFFLFSFSYGKYVYKTSVLVSIGIALIACFGLHFTKSYIYQKYDYVFEHYYETTPQDNLLAFHSYMKRKGNFPTVIRELKEVGYKPFSVEQGFTDKYNWKTQEEYNTYTKSIYFVNKTDYVLFDWSTESIVEIVSTEQLAKQYLLEIAESSLEKIVFTEMVVYLNQLTLKIVPSEKNTIILVDK